MTFQATPARSSRITKPRTQSAAAAFGLRRTTSSPSAVSPRKKSLPSEAASIYDDEVQLEDDGVVTSLATDLNFRDVPQFMEHIQNRMFSEMPEKPGMNSTRIAEILNFRRQLPPFVLISHIDALSGSPTRVEREIAELAKAGVLRRATIPHRGVGAAAVGDGIASTRDWRALVQAHSELPDTVKSKYISVMDANCNYSTVSSSAFLYSELAMLTTFGFLTSATSAEHKASWFAAPGATSLTAISASGSRHAAGSNEAVGGVSATQHIHGGTCFGASRSSHTLYNLSLPNTGMLIKLLVEARDHLINLLKKMKFKEAPLSILRERWDGGIIVYDERTERKRGRGEFVGVLPGRTRKWKQFYGLRFEWVLEECLGAGLVELFETRSVGRAVRLTS